MSSCEQCGERKPASCPEGFRGRYTVTDDDTMYLIAQRFGVSLNALILANPQITNPNIICPGDVLCVPPGSSECGHREPSSCPPGFGGRYTVQNGDTMFTISQMFGVTLQALIAANPQISNPNIICPGDVLCVPGGPAPTATCAIVLNPTSALPVGSQSARGTSLTYTGNQPPLIRPVVWGVLATLLPQPGTLGNWNEYQAVLFDTVTGLAFELDLHETEDGAWAGQLVNIISAEITSSFRVQVRLANINTGATGPTVLFGTLADCD